MMDLATPKVLLYHGYTPILSAAIRWQTWGSVSHAALWFPEQGVYEAGIHGVIQRDQKDPAEDGAEVYSVTCPITWSSVWMYAMSQVGKPYDFVGLFRFISRAGQPANPKRWFCSDFVFECVLQGGVVLVQRVPRCKVSPEQLRRSPLLVREA